MRNPPKYIYIYIYILFKTYSLSLTFSNISITGRIMKPRIAVKSLIVHTRSTVHSILATRSERVIISTVSARFCHTQPDRVHVEAMRDSQRPDHSRIYQCKSMEKKEERERERERERRKEENERLAALTLYLFPCPSTDLHSYVKELRCCEVRRHDAAGEKERIGIVVINCSDRCFDELPWDRSKYRPSFSSFCNEAINRGRNDPLRRIFA